MKSQQLQALLRSNAAAIHNEHATIAQLKAAARERKAEGFVDLVKSIYKMVSKHRNKLAKLVELQRSLKVELQYNQRIERINALHIEVFGRPPAGPQYTSIEQEQMLMILAYEKREYGITIDAEAPAE